MSFILKLCMFSSFSSLIIAFALCWKVTSDTIKISLCWKLWSYFGVCRKVGSFIQTHCHLICQILSTKKLQKFIRGKGWVWLSEYISYLLLSSGNLTYLFCRHIQKSSSRYYIHTTYIYIHMCAYIYTYKYTLYM